MREDAGRPNARQVRHDWSLSHPSASFRAALPEGIVKTLLALAVTLSSLALPARAQQEAPGVEGSHAPLAPFAGRKVIVLPAGFLSDGDTLHWAAQVPDAQEYLRSFDAELEFALKDRRLGKAWVMVSRLPIEYRRDQDFMADPFELAGDWLRFPGPKKLVPYLPDPLAGQLRSILSVNDKAEYVLYPVEIRFEPVKGTTAGRAALRAAIIDPRRLKIDWMADVYSDTEDKFTPALLTSLAEHLANLFAAP